MLNSMLSQRLSSNRLSRCALAAFTVLCSTNSSQAWTSEKTLTRNLSSGGATLVSKVRMTEVSAMTLVQLPCRSDNYGYLVHDPVTGDTAAVDTPCGRTYKEELAKRGWKLTHILNTHHHNDHTGANMELKDEDVVVFGPIDEKAKIPGIDKPVGAGDIVQFGNYNIRVMDAGGHTKGHIAYYIPEESKVFVGDCLFSLGCGRMFEGHKAQFWSSLEGLRALPDETMVYCAHEYTQSNGNFALSVEPNNQDLVDRMTVVKAKRARGEPTVPSLLGEEKKANPFLRVDISDEIRKNIGVTESDSAADAFGKLRKAKDNF